MILHAIKRKKLFTIGYIVPNYIETAMKSSLSCFRYVQYIWGELFYLITFSSKFNYLFHFYHKKLIHVAKTKHTDYMHCMYFVTIKHLLVILNLLWQNACCVLCFRYVYSFFLWQSLIWMIQSVTKCHCNKRLHFRWHHSQWFRGGYCFSNKLFSILPHKCLRTVWMDFVLTRTHTPLSIYLYALCGCSWTLLWMLSQSQKFKN